MAKGAQLGQVWDGALQPILDGLDPVSRKMVLERIAVYGEMNAAKEKPNGTEDDEDPWIDGNRELAMRSAAQDQLNARTMNEAARKFWDERSA